MLLAPGKRYFLSAFTRYGSGDFWSDPVTATIVAPELPGVSGFTATAGVRSARLTFVMPELESGSTASENLLVVRSTRSFPSSPGAGGYVLSLYPDQKSAGTTVGYTDSGLVAGRRYYSAFIEYESSDYRVGTIWSPAATATAVPKIPPAIKLSAASTSVRYGTYGTLRYSLVGLSSANARLERSLNAGRHGPLSLPSR